MVVHTNRLKCKFINIGTTRTYFSIQRISKVGKWCKDFNKIEVLAHKKVNEAVLKVAAKVKLCWDFTNEI